MMDSVGKFMNKGLKFMLMLGCLLGPVAAQSGERIVLCEEFTNQY